MKLSVKIAGILTIFSVLSAGLVGYLSYYYGRRTIEERTFNHLVSTNLLKEKEFSRWVENADQHLRGLARRPSIRQLVESLNLYGGSSSQYQLVRTEIYQEHLMPTLEEGKGFFELFIMRNKDGKVAVSTSDKEEGKFRRNEHYFLQGRSRTTVQSAYYSLSYERPMTTIGTPIKDRDGKTIGVLAGHMDLTEMSAIMAQGRELSDGEETYLVNKFNFFVTENRFEPDLPLKKAIHTKGVNDCLKGKSGVGMYDDYRGIPVIGAYHWMAGRELCILTEVDQAEAFAPIVALGKSVFGIGASVGLLAIVLGIFFSRTITGPVRRLVKGTEEVGRGNLDYRQQVERGDEIGHLSRAFNQMTENLKSITASLHQEIIEHQQAEEQIQRQHQRKVALHDINVAVTSTLDLPTVLEVLLRQIDHLLPYPAAMLLLVNKETGELDRVACLNLDEQEWKRRELGIPPFAMKVIKNKHPLAITNMQTDPRTLDPEYFRKHGLVSNLEIPLIAKEEVLGVLAVLTREEHRFSTEEIEFLTTLGGEAAIAIHNSRLYEQVEKKTAEISALQTITATASESLDLDTVLREVITKITEIFHFDATRIFLFNPQMNELHLRASFETHPEFWAQVRTFRRGQGNVGRVAETGEPLIFEDIHEDHQYQELSHTKNTQKAGLSFLGIFPIKSKLRTLGAILCMGRDPRHLTSDEIQLITSMTDQIGVSVENANLFEETRERAKELSALYSVATVVNQSLDFNLVLRSVMEKVLEIFHFDAARVYLFDDDKKELCLLAQQGFPMNALPESYKPGQGILGNVFEKGEPILFEDIQSDPMFRRMIYKRIALKAGFRGSFGIPIKVKDKTVGVINFVSKNVHQFLPNEVQLIQSLTNHIGVALENARLYEQTKEQTVQLKKDIIERKQVEEELKHSRELLRNLAQHIESVRERERAQIARDVHDDLGQSLAALKLDLYWLKKRLPKNQDPLLERTKSMSQLIDSTMRRVREISTELRPGVLDDFGLTEAIRWQAQVFQNRTDIKCKLAPSVKDIPLDRTQSISLFRIFKESLTNVSLHSHATEIKVSLERNRDRVLLEIIDNGRGITNRQISSPKSLGIQGMRERALFLGGELNIGGIKGEGTTVSIRVPLDKSGGS